MARNGSGTYVLPAGNPVVTGTTISSTWANNTLTDIGNALTQSIATDGQTAAAANLPMGGFAHTGVGNATVRTMYPSMGQVQDNVAQYLTTVAGTDVITAIAGYVMTAYVTGQRFSFVAAGTNTGATTININSIGAKSITKKGSTALVAGDIVSGTAYEVVYDGTQFQLINPSSSTTTATAIYNAGGWSVTPTGTTLYFNYNGTNVGKLDSSGNFTVTGNIISNGTV